MGLKLSLMLGGIFFMILGLAMLLLQGGGGMMEAFFFMAVGIGCFIGLDVYNARQPKPSGLRIIEDETTSETTPTTSMDEEIYEAAAVAGGGGGGSARMNHLEYAEALFQKIIAAPSEESVVTLVEKGLGDVTGMGYTDKGVNAFLGKLGGNLAAMNDKQFPEQAMKNRTAALATLSRLRNLQSPP